MNKCKIKVCPYYSTNDDNLCKAYIEVSACGKWSDFNNLHAMHVSQILEMQNDDSLLILSLKTVIAEQKAEIERLKANQIPGRCGDCDFSRGHMERGEWKIDYCEADNDAEYCSRFTHREVQK